MFYVVSHLDKKIDLPNEYSFIYVGNLTKDIKGIHDSDSDDNIAYKNPYYSELTAYYYIWKNLNDSYIGIDHYRRFLSWKRFSFNNKYLVSQEDLKKYNVDVILPKKYTFANSYKLQNLPEVNYSLEVLENIFKRQFSDYYQTYVEVLESKSLHLCNMLLTSKDIFDSYCRWLFPILTELEKEIDYKNFEGKAQRVFGFVSECLLNVYFKQNNFKIKEAYIVTPEIKITTRLINRVRNFFREKKTK